MVIIGQNPRRNAPRPSNDVRVLCTLPMIAPESRDKDEFMHVFYWGRQMFALLLGVIYGSVPLKGAGALLLFFAINAGIVYLYAVNIKDKNHSTCIGPWELNYALGLLIGCI